MTDRCQCQQCGKPLQTLVTLASDPQDQPVYHCPCWPMDWPATIFVVAMIIGFIAVVYLAVRFS